MGFAAIAVVTFFSVLDLAPVLGQDVTVDLRTGTYSPLDLGPGFSWTVPLAAGSNLTDCNQEGVLKLTFDNSTRKRAQIDMEVKYFLVYSWKHITFDIGDSEWNTGFGDDNGKQTNDAEITGRDWGLFVYGSDYDNPTTETYNAFYGSSFYLDTVESVNITISDNSIIVNNGKIFIHIDSTKLFAINGQPDQQGPVNNDIFIGMNRGIVDYHYKVDSNGGLCRVSVTWHDS